jgi:hypothetical protein
MTDIRKRERPTTAAVGIILRLLLLLCMAMAPDVVQAKRRASKSGEGTSSSTSATTPAVTTKTAATKSKAMKTTVTTTAFPGAPLDELYFYPATFEGNTFCFRGAKTSITALAKQQESFLYSSMCECCRKHKCVIDMSVECGTTAATTTAATTATAAVTTTPASYPMPTTPAAPTGNHRYYPLRGGDVVICVAATTETSYPANVDFFSDVCECCKKNGCTIPMDHCDETTTTTTATVTDATSANTMITVATTTTAGDAECQTEPFSVKVGTGCKEFFYCEGGRIIEKMACPAGLFFNGGHCDLASNVNCDPDPECREKPDSISAMVSTGCKDYVFCENGLLLGKVTCPDGLLFNGAYCDSAEKVVCASNIQYFDTSTLVKTSVLDGNRTR